MDDTQSEAVLQFITVTGADASEARSILESCGWNIDQAVELHFNLGGGGANTGAALTGGQRLEREPSPPF